MGFFDDVINTTKTVAANAGKKTDEAVKFSKLKIKKSQIKGDIKVKFEKLGSSVYQMTKSGEKDNDAIDASIAEIDECYEKLSEIEKQIDELKSEVTCVSCGAKTKNDNNFCPKCGTKLPVPEVKEEPAEEAAAEEKPAEADVIVEEKKAD